MENTKLDNKTTVSRSRPLIGSACDCDLHFPNRAIHEIMSLCTALEAREFYLRLYKDCKDKAGIVNKSYFGE